MGDQNFEKMLISAMIYWCLTGFNLYAQPSYENYNLVWADEFNDSGLPSSSNWDYEVGYVRNSELQYYTKQRQENVRQEDGNLIFEARRDNWQGNEYTAASLYSRGKREFQYGIFEMRGKIDIREGSWPAFWTLGVSGEWPSNGEVDIMEYYNGLLHANVAWATSERWNAHWSSKTKAVDDAFAKEYHVWRMHWTKDKIDLWVDDFLQNSTSLSTTINDNDGRNPFHQNAYIMVNQAIGSNGGDPSGTTFPIKYYIDYIRVYQEGADTTAPTVADAVAWADGVAVILFSEEVEKNSAETVSNYTVEGSGKSISSAKLQEDTKTVVLTFSGLEEGASLKITVKGIQDDASNANTLKEKAVSLTVGPESEKLTGTIIGNGTPWENNTANSYNAAMDGNTSTFSDCTGDLVYVGYDFGAADNKIITGIRYYPRSGYMDRMSGRSIEVSSNGTDWKKIYVIPGVPEEESFTKALLACPEPVRYVRYNGSGGYLNVSEIEFLGYPASLTAIRNEQLGDGCSVTNLFSNQPVSISLYSIDGKLIEKRNVPVMSSIDGLRSFVKNDLKRGPLSKGIYFMSVNAEDGKKILNTKLVTLNTR